MNKEKVIYISGKITGLCPKEVEKKFNEASKHIQETMNGIPVSPLNNGLGAEHSWSNHMKADIAIMMKADAIFMLDNWHDSKGATIEHNLAKELDMKIIYQNKN